jgi:hypothetical protein
MAVEINFKNKNRIKVKNLKKKNKIEIKLN